VHLSFSSTSRTTTQRKKTNSEGASSLRNSEANESASGNCGWSVKGEMNNNDGPVNPSLSLAWLGPRRRRTGRSSKAELLIGPGLL